MQQVDSIQPPTMGDTGAASTTATAFAGASRATGERANYKSLTFENTFLCELYWMIHQMTFVFAKPETGIDLFGEEKLYDFDPTKNYYYKPLSQSIEPEHSKMVKRKEWITLLGYIMQSGHPDAPKMFNYIMVEIVKLMGDEYTNISSMLLGEDKPLQLEGGVGAVAGGGVPTSNQSGTPMSGMEMDARGTANIGAY